jgi:HK97 family phage prohead protease
VQLATNSATFCTPTLALFNHDFKSVIGNTANNTLRIGQADATGIPIEIDLPDTTTGNDIAELVSKGYIAGMSFSMANGFEQYSEANVSGTNVLTCTKFTVDEVTVTAVPAFTSTSIGVKDDEDTDSDDDANDTDEPIDLSSRITASLKLKKMRLADLSMHTGRVSEAT